MNNKTHSTTREITYIAIGVSTMIVGGLAIFQLSLVFPIPGVKFILLAPYLALLFYILLSIIKQKNALIKIGCTLALIMVSINLFMGLAILLTSIISQLSITLISHEKKPFYGAILFSGFTGLTSLLISKFVIGGIFEEISNIWILFTFLICLGFGIVGTILAKRIMRHLKVALK